MVDREVPERVGGRDAGSGCKAMASEEPGSRFIVRTSGNRRPEEREAGVEVERAAEPSPGRRVVAEAALDHPAMEELQRVLNPEMERELRVALGLPAPTGARQAPRQTTSAASIDGRAAASGGRA